MKKVKKLIDAGAPISDAITIALKGEGFATIAAFAEKQGRDRSNITHAINGTRRASDADIEALMAVLGGTPDEWRELLHEAGRPSARAS
jgi:hypothetical protein